LKPERKAVIVIEIDVDASFHSVLPDDHTRVILNNKEDSDYINATMIEVIIHALISLSTQQKE
jgi:protein tyrosine phosphatase